MRQQKYLRENLLKIRENIVKFQGHCGPAVNPGFSLAVIDQTVSIAKPDVTKLDLMKGTFILNAQVYSDVTKVIKVTWLKFLPGGNLGSLSCHVSEYEDELMVLKGIMMKINWVVIAIMQLWFHQVAVIFSVLLL